MRIASLQDVLAERRLAILSGDCRLPGETGRVPDRRGPGYAYGLATGVGLGWGAGDAYGFGSEDGRGWGEGRISYLQPSAGMLLPDVEVL